MKHTQEEIKAEIEALKALIPIGPFKVKTANTIDIQIDALENGVDDTCEEWEELSDEQQDAARDADNWAQGRTKTRPSQDWGDLVIVKG